MIVDVDATLVTAHAEKERAEPTHKRGSGLAPMCAFVDHGEHGSGETLAVDPHETVRAAVEAIPERKILGGPASVM